MGSLVFTFRSCKKSEWLSVRLRPTVPNTAGALGLVISAKEESGRKPMGLSEIITL